MVGSTRQADKWNASKKGRHQLVEKMAVFRRGQVQSPTRRSGKEKAGAITKKRKAVKKKKATFFILGAGKGKERKKLCRPLENGALLRLGMGFGVNDGT